MIAIIESLLLALTDAQFDRVLVMISEGFSAIQSARGRSATGHWRQAAQPFVMCTVSGTVDAAQAASVLPRLARSASGRRLRIQSQVGQDLLDHRSLQDGRDDLELPGAAVGAVLHVDVEHALE